MDSFDWLGTVAGNLRRSPSGLGLPICALVLLALLLCINYSVKAGKLLMYG